METTSLQIQNLSSPSLHQPLQFNPAKPPTAKPPLPKGGRSDAGLLPPGTNPVPAAGAHRQQRGRPPAAAAVPGGEGAARTDARGRPPEPPLPSRVLSAADGALTPGPGTAERLRAGRGRPGDRSAPRAELDPPRGPAPSRAPSVPPPGGPPAAALGPAPVGPYCPGSAPGTSPPPSWAPHTRALPAAARRRHPPSLPPLPGSSADGLRNPLPPAFPGASAPLLPPFWD